MTEQPKAAGDVSVRRQGYTFQVLDNAGEVLSTWFTVEEAIAAARNLAPHQEQIPVDERSADEW